ncbi:hypothetical protein SESBI_15544 [Sesbania bispinosa]|nr:hypothetical protein SESBI_15544 [Sesbania bispinosa]
MNESSLSITQPSDLEEVEILLESNEQEATKTAQRTLVGKILSGKSLNRNAAKEILSKAWAVQEEINIVDLGPNLFMFSFSDKKIAKRILEEGPCFWVQLHGLPLELMNISNAAKIVGKIGKVQMVENPYSEGILLRPFIQEYVYEAGLVDLDLKGNQFTWFSNQRQGRIVKEKLDRVLVNWAWSSMDPNAIATAYPAISTDHSTILLDIKPQTGSNRAFKYEALWDDHVECKKGFPSRTSIELNVKLCREVTEAEIKEAINDLGSLKAPGPDGLNGLFFKSHWETIKEDIIQAIKSFFHGGNLPLEFNETLLVMVPKVDKPESVSQFRPISCCREAHRFNVVQELPLSHTPTFC